jgi:tetratricopeptide (TPR) repeat protein
LSAPLLSAALIVRDEERHLADCLESVRPIVDEIVVVDTGSRDRTREIARAFGARLYEIAWEDDFAAARNAALERCRGRWILYIDADERLRPCSRSEIERALRRWRRVGYYVRLHAKRGYTAYREMRLFRNHPEIRFEGAMHENIWPALERYAIKHVGFIGASPLVLDHVGYEGEPARKHGRDLPLLLKALEADPDRVYCWYHLGRVYRDLGQIERTQEAWRRGVEVVRAQRRTVATDSLPYVELIRLGIERGEPVGDLLREARRRFPKQATLVWLEGELRLRERRPAEAAQHFAWLLRRGGRGRPPDDLGYDERLFGAWPTAALATCLLQQGRYEESGRYFARAEALEPDRLEHRVKRALCAQLAAEARERRA